MNLLTWLMALVGLLVGGVAGAFAYAAWMRSEASARLRVPRKWPLGARGVVTMDEHEALEWLRDIFKDHLVMVKIPVLRFTIPLERDKGKTESERWLELLNGVYTTFTVCTTDGKVMGCVDVIGKRGQSKASRELKESLLSDCGIAYTTVRVNRLPHGSAMRAAFLGEMPVEIAQEAEETRGGDSSFHADLDAFTRQRMKATKDAALKELNKDAQKGASAPAQQSVGFNSYGTGGIQSGDSEDRFAVQWEDSFIQPPETRPAKLE